MDVGSGVHLHLPIQGIFVLNLENQNLGILDTISDHLNAFRRLIIGFHIFKKLLKHVIGVKQMSNIKYFAFAPIGSLQMFSVEPKEANIQVVNMDSDFFKGCIFGNAGWFVKPLQWYSFFKHRSDNIFKCAAPSP